MINYQNIEMSFNNKSVLKNFSLAIPKGGKVLVQGRSGVGKSLLFKLLLGFIIPQQGQIYFDNQLVDHKTIWEVRKKIAYVSQDTDLGGGLVKEVVGQIFSFRANAHLKLEQSKVLGLLEQFELPADVMDKNLGELSGGERQRLAIIMALLLERQVFLLDEATAALDSKLKQRVIETFSSNPHWTVVAISHDTQWLDNQQLKIYQMEERQWTHRI